MAYFILLLGIIIIIIFNIIINNNHPPENFPTNKIIIYNFNTSWCTYSIKFQPIWDKFSKLVNNSNIKINDIKCDQEDNIVLCNKYNIPGYPSVVKVTSSGYELYQGPRSVDGLLNFIKT